MRNSIERFKVLYIEDNTANVILVEQILEDREDIILYSALNPVKGLEIAEKQHPDLILLDINLPDMDGFEVQRILADSPTTNSIPVIYLSADAMPADIERALEAGFVDYIVKPIDVALFLRKVDKVLGIDAGAS